MTYPQQAQKSDAKAIAKIVNAAYRHYVERMGKKPGPMLDDYASIIAEHSVWVIKEQGEIIGSLVLMKKDGWMLLDNVAVRPDHQGRKLGKRLCQFAEQEAIRQGFSEIRLYTHETMVENVAIYQKMGYVEFERRHELGYARIYMRKQLVM